METATKKREWLFLIWVVLVTAVAYSAVFYLLSEFIVAVRP